MNLSETFRPTISILSSLILLCAIAGGGCTSRSVVYQPRIPVALGGSDASCKVVQSKGQWQAVWDMYRIFDADFSDYEFQPSRTYSYRMEDLWTDWLINATVGFLTTVTRHTVHLMECDQEVVIRTPEEIRKQVDETLAQHLKDESTTRENKRQPVFFTRDGQSYQGRLLEMNSQDLVIEIEVRQEPEGETAESEEGSEGEEGTIDRVRMKNGEVLDGKVVNQDISSVTLRIKENGETKNRTIKKSDIAQLRFGLPASEAAKIETKRITLKRTDLERIALPR